MLSLTKAQTFSARLLLACAVGLLLVILSALHMAAEARPLDATKPGQSYTSFCERNDMACYLREINFMLDHGREPITDQELMDVYDITFDQLFQGETDPHTVSFHLDLGHHHRKITLF